MSVKIMGGMPKADHNGLAGQEDRIEQHKGELIPLVVLCEVEELGRVLSTDEPVVKLRMAEVEIVEEAQAVALLRAGRRNRTGHDELDLEGLEDAGE